MGNETFYWDGPSISKLTINGRFQNPQERLGLFYFRRLTTFRLDKSSCL